MGVLRQTGRDLPSATAVVGFLMSRGAVVEPLPETSGVWPSRATRVYLPNTSTRGLALTVEAGRLTITVPTLSCAEERSLAWDLAMSLGGGFVASGDDFPSGVVFTSGAPRADAFARDVAEVAARARRAVVTLPGPVRDFHVGPRLVDELGIEPAAWLAAMRRVQYGTVEEAPRERRSTEHGSVSVVSAQPGTKAVIAWCDLVALGGDDDAIAVPFARFVELTSGRAVPLDERNVVLGALSRTEWDSLVERARPYAVEDLFEATPSVAAMVPLSVELSEPEDTASGPPIVRASSEEVTRPLATLGANRWVVPLLAALLVALVALFGSSIVLALAVLLPR